MQWHRNRRFPEQNCCSGKKRFCVYLRQESPFSDWAALEATQPKRLSEAVSELWTCLIRIGSAFQISTVRSWQPVRQSGSIKSTLRKNASCQSTKPPRSAAIRFSSCLKAQSNSIFGNTITSSTPSIQSPERSPWCLKRKKPGFRSYLPWAPETNWIQHSLRSRIFMRHLSVLWRALCARSSAAEM